MRLNVVYGIETCNGGESAVRIAAKTVKLKAEREPNPQALRYLVTSIAQPVKGQNNWSGSEFQ